MIKNLLLLVLVFCVGCGTMAVDYHLARITETSRVSRQNYHIERIKEISGPDSPYNLSEGAHVEPKTFTLGLGGFTTSSKF